MYGHSLITGSIGITVSFRDVTWLLTLDPFLILLTPSVQDNVETQPLALDKVS